MKKYCVDLEIAKQLQRHRFKSCSNKWCYNEETDNYFITDDLIGIGCTVFYKCQAPMAEEILAELPPNTKIEKLNFSLGWFISNEFETPGMNWSDNKLSNALAKMWLSLKKEGLLNENCRYK